MLVCYTHLYASVLYTFIYTPSYVSLHSTALYLRLKRSVRSNGYAPSQISYGSQSNAPMTPRTPTAMSITSPVFTDIDAPSSRPFFDDTRTRCVCSYVCAKIIHGVGLCVHVL